ncbi:peptidase U32 family protein [Gracilinema caldarium]|uniref:Peptidase U32 n=1 Tax=Gracilinema caldarium (strain ATCC 51460 / DSM 7334 / H1) TaxID=744872 RepID=F8EXD8_GRAC1|nr:peptidase U32 family protein [Gracilinema caldarium]AEJ19165.1 peptidase U32 [Gracilinema caldarium DSM 7334]
MKSVEIMAPAGSRESLVAALKAGADSVYFGVGKLDMRSLTSTAFTPENLPEIGSLVKKYGAKAYITLNAVIFDSELEELYKILESAQKAGIDGVIASDMAVINGARKLGIPVHLSTQANISNIEAVQFYSTFADVMVLARELSLDQIRHIRNEIVLRDIRGPSGSLVRLEAFVHGAICMAYSGKCYLSLHLMGSSANRGACLQSCRRTYILKDRETDQEIEVDHGYLMSAADLKTIGFLDKILNAGIEVLKIEGRARSAEYVDTVVRCYREAVDAVADGSFKQERVADWDRRLATVFNRGFWDGHYLGQKMAVWTDAYGSKASLTKEYVGNCVNYYPRAQIAEIELKAGDIQVGDQLLISGPTTGVVYLEVSELRVDEVSEQHALKGARCTLPCPERVREGDKVYIRKMRP